MQTGATRLVRLTSAALLLCLLVSCGGAPKQIVGKWKTTTGTNESIWEFFGSGSLNHDSTPGRYRLDNDRLKIITPSATFAYRFEIKGDAMIWTPESGAPIQLMRVK